MGLFAKKNECWQGILPTETDVSSVNATGAVCGGILAILRRTDRLHPEKDENFMQVVAKIHLDKQALEFVSMYSFMSEIYAKELCRRYDNVLSYDIEERIIRSGFNLVYCFGAFGYFWSKDAFELIKMLYPYSSEYLHLCERSV